jgi:hypothetical protein
MCIIGGGGDESEEVEDEGKGRFFFNSRSQECMAVKEAAEVMS